MRKTLKIDNVLKTKGKPTILLAFYVNLKAIVVTFFCSGALWFRFVVFGFDGGVGVDGLRESFLVPRLTCQEIGLGITLRL